jgi:prepilin-type N-terminal cleavage/methylation domain-containing protein
MNKRHNAFTLVEILVVLAIIAILAAILFPAFNRAKENSRQVNCASNLSQIGFAVLQYRKDEGRYPDSLVDLLGEGTKVIDAQTAGDYKLDGKATGYLKGGQDTLVCPDDDTLPLDKGARSSYGYLSKSAPAPALTAPGAIPATTDLSGFVWNYWGYREDGFAYSSPQEAQAKTPAGSSLLYLPTINVNGSPVNQSYNQRYAPGYNPNIPENVLKYSMSNRFAPPTTIITHCVYHRLPTANNINFPGDLYKVPADDTNVKEIVLRIDGSAKAIDVSQCKTADQKTTLWQTQTQ